MYTAFIYSFVSVFPLRTADESALEGLCWVPFGFRSHVIEAKGGILSLQPTTGELGGRNEGAISVDVPPDAISPSDNIEMHYAIIPSGSFTLPKGYKFGSMVVYIYYDGRRVSKSLRLHLPHWYGGRNLVRDGLSFAIAPHSLKKGSRKYHFELVQQGTFLQHQQYGIYDINGHSSLFSIVFKEKATSDYLATQWNKLLDRETRTSIVITYNSTVWPEVVN